MEFPSNIKYHPEHTWARVEGDTAIIGITEYAQDQLGEILFVDLPDKGKKIKQGEVFGSVESAKVASDLFTPVSGEVIEVNTELSDSPELVNESPYEKGWMLKVKMDDVKELEKLMDSSSYKKSL
ncbi:MAG TPA: glycine cleavage system protein GcvH [Thermoanaerobacterales bacterium]|nr:glycine cleavage system protein GcvH [Thermoanaerobacterales bacterium]